MVLTASDAYQYARDGESIGDAPAQSLFTRHMVEGLRTGDADLDGDGQITVDELYFYVERKVVDERRGQRPAMSALDQAGRLVLAESRRGRTRMLPDDLVAAASSPYAQVRAGAVEALAGFLDDSRTSAAREAETLPEGLRADDSRRVSQAATEALLPRSAAAERPDESPTAEPPTERRVDEAESTPRPAQVEAPAAVVERGSLAVNDADTAMADDVGPVVDLDTRQAPHDHALPPPTRPRRRRRGPALVAVAGAVLAASALKWTGMSDWLTPKPKAPTFLTTTPSIGADLTTIDARNRSSAVAEFLRSSSTTTVLDPPSTAAGVPSQRTVIRVGVPTEMGALDPHRPDGVTGAAQLVYEPLVRQTATGYEPVLALSWTWSSDMKELTMRLRPGVKFQDGRSFDAQAAASNIQRWEAARSMKSAVATGDEVEKIFTEVGDPLMIRLRLPVKADPLGARRSGSGIDCFIGKVICEFFDLLDHLSELLIVSPSTFNVGVVKPLTDIVGTGPWRITTKASTNAEFVPNLKYWGPQPNPHRLLLTTIVDSGAREAAVKDGEVDFSDDESLTTLRLQLTKTS